MLHFLSFIRTPMVPSYFKSCHSSKSYFSFFWITMQSSRKKQHTNWWDKLGSKILFSLELLKTMKKVKYIWVCPLILELGDTASSALPCATGSHVFASPVLYQARPSSSDPHCNPGKLDGVGIIIPISLIRKLNLKAT